MNDIISDGLEKELGYIIISVFIMLIISVPSPQKSGIRYIRKNVILLVFLGNQGIIGLR